LPARSSIEATTLMVSQGVPLLGPLGVLEWLAVKGVLGDPYAPEAKTRHQKAAIPSSVARMMTKGASRASPEC
jgi:hypothetical protein